MAHLKGNKVSQFGHKQQSLRTSVAFPVGKSDTEISPLQCSHYFPSPGTLASPSLPSCCLGSSLVFSLKLSLKPLEGPSEIIQHAHKHVKLSASGPHASFK